MQTSNMLKAEMAMSIALTGAKKGIVKVSRTEYLFLLFKKLV
jgi:hypothetical protein